MYDCKSKCHKFESQLCNITFVTIDHEIISPVIFLLPLSQEGQLSVTDKSMCRLFRGLNTFSRFFAISAKEDNFFLLPVCFTVHQFSYEKGPTL